MASLGALVVSLGMDTARFTAGVSKSVQQMARLTAEAGKIGAAIGTSVVTGVTAIGNLVKQSVDAADRIGELAEMTGVTTEEMSKLAYVAKLSATDSETLAASLSKLSRQMAEAASGSESAAAGFDAMGISVKNSDGTLKGTTEVLAEVADKFASYQDGAAKSALAQEIFGKSGAQLIPLLNRGSSGIAELAAEADKLGLTLSGSAANAAGEFNDRLDQLQAAKQGLGVQIAQRLLPTLNNLTGSLFNSAKNADAFGKAAEIAATGVKILVSAGAIIIGVFKTVGDVLGGLAATVVALLEGRFRDAFNIAADTATGFTENIKGSVNSVKAVWDTTAGSIASEAGTTGSKIAAPVVVGADKVGKATKKIKSDLEKAYEDVQRQIGNIMREVQTFGMGETSVKLFDLRAMGATEGQLAEAQRYLQELDRLKKTEEDLKKAQEERQRIEERGKNLYAETRTPLEQLNIKLAEYQMLLDKGAISWDTFGRLQDKAQDDFENIGKQVEKGKSLAEELGLSFTSAFEDAIVGGKGFSEVLKGLEQDILRVVTRKLVTEPLGNALTGLLGGSTGGGFLSGVGNFIKGLIPGFAVGSAYIPRDTLAMLHKGERVVTAADNANGNVGDNRRGLARQMIFNIAPPPGTNRASTNQMVMEMARKLNAVSRKNG